MIVEERDGIYEEDEAFHGYYKGHYFHKNTKCWVSSKYGSLISGRYPKTSSPETLIIPRQFL